ncbi:MAG: hypothetical protein ABI076_00865 [Acidobacteriaceae bacterium]
MAHTTPDAPSHTPGTAKGENRADPVQQRRTRMASDATGINPEASGPIDPRMPHMPPA